MNIPPPPIPGATPGYADADLSLHRRLARRNELRFRPTFERELSLNALQEEMADRQAEESFIARARAGVTNQLSGVPEDADGFIAWFEGLREHGPGQGDPLFPWLAEEATLDQMRWFLGQEVAGEAGFEDLLALTQLKMPATVKLELARNFWDEMGQGHEVGMHGPLLARLADSLDVHVSAQQILAEPLSLANLLSALAWNRHYAFQSLGALGAIELTAPGRAAFVNAGLRRLGCPPEVRKYFALHATLDVKHSASWNREVLRPLVVADRRCARAFAEGALLRLQAGADCFVAYRAHLWQTSARACA